MGGTGNGITAEVSGDFNHDLAGMKSWKLSAEPRWLATFRTGQDRSKRNILMSSPVFPMGKPQGGLLLFGKC